MWSFVITLVRPAYALGLHESFKSFLDEIRHLPRIFQLLQQIKRVCEDDFTFLHVFTSAFRV